MVDGFRNSAAISLSLSLSLSLFRFMPISSSERDVPRAGALIFSRNGRNFVAAAAEKTQNRDTARLLRKYLSVGEVTRAALACESNERAVNNVASKSLPKLFLVRLSIMPVSPMFTSSLPARVSINEKRIIRDAIGLAADRDDPRPLFFIPRENRPGLFGRSIAVCRRHRMQSAMQSM